MEKNYLYKRLIINTFFIFNCFLIVSIINNKNCYASSLTQSSDNFSTNLNNDIKIKRLFVKQDHIYYDIFYRWHDLSMTDKQNFLPIKNEPVLKINKSFISYGLWLINIISYIIFGIFFRDSFKCESNKIFKMSIIILLKFSVILTILSIFMMVFFKKTLKTKSVFFYILYTKYKIAIVVFSILISIIMHCGILLSYNQNKYQFNTKITIMDFILYSILHIITCIIFLNNQFLNMFNINYYFNSSIKKIYMTEIEIKIYKKLMPYLIKSNKTIFDLADDDPEALKILNS